jgi:hypothetical protein
MKGNLFLVLSLLIVTTCLSAGNSVFSFDGTPCQNYGYDIYGITMGNVGVSDVFRKNTGYANPAILGAGTNTLFSTGMMFGWTGYKSKNGTEKSYRDNSLDFPFFSVGIPVQNHHLGFQFISLASGVVEDKISFNQLIYNGTTVMDTLLITEQQNIDRYMYRGDLLYAYHYHHLNFGAGLNYYFGHDIRKFYQNGDFGIFNASETMTTTYKNPSATAGFTADYNNLAGGIYYTLGCDLEGDRTRTSIHETENLGKIKYSVPSQIGVGGTVKIDNEFKVSADYVMSFWKDAKYSGYDKDSWKIGIGFAHDPKAGSRETFLGKLPKRAGLSYRILPFDVNGNPVSETAVSTGFSFPLQNSENQLDFGLQYLLRGNLDKNNLQDRSLMFIVGITGFDILTKAFNRTAPREIPKVEEITE